MAFTVKYQGFLYKRVGRCKKCGKCCAEGIQVFFLVGKQTEEEGIDPASLEFGRREKAVCVLFNPRTKKCRRRSLRPEVCKLYPPNPGVPLPKGCGYSWEKLQPSKEKET